MILIADKINMLRGVELFSDTPDTVLEALAHALKEIEIAPNENIIRKGDQGNCMYIIYDGLVKVHDGEHTIAHVGNSKIFGELALLNPEPRSASVTAVETTMLLRLDQDDFYRIMADRIEVTKGLIRLLISRIKNQNNSIIESLKQREAQLVALVEERTADLREEKVKLQLAYEEISAQNENLEKAYEEINKQKDELQEKTRNITSSINYAKRIQDSILPSLELIQQYLPNSFVLFKPRDTVSGDFYWFMHKEDMTWIAAVDCTGHGVPGAFMSMIGNTLLNQIVNEKQHITPAEVLRKLHIGVRKALKQDQAESKNRDGMDIALCCVDTKKQQILYAGANRPLLLIQHNELIEYKADKHSIGGLQMETERLFTDVAIPIVPQTYLYLFSDGYVDQFGGKDNRKFMSKKFKELVMLVHERDFEEQCVIFDHTIEQWKEGYSQIDDIMVIGFRVA